ncbi:mucin-4 [Venturia canescens]|uniref:mucin-4 n=1 Tax=Venturia canescens TaxID=32260 RepID=UPI001C9C5C2D|nr:mucin-4 [Venturia canescens]
MRRQRWWLPLIALVCVSNWKSALTLPVPDEELDTSKQLLGSSVVTSVSIVTGPPETHHNADTKTSTADRKRVIPVRDMPASPADLMRPDKIQFIALNKEGNVVTKQMTEKEILSLIATGGGHLPMEIHETQKVGEIPTGGMKVADVVQNVQNVLKSELNKPATVMTSVPTIPGHAHTEWSSILPAILGGDAETASMSEHGSPVASVINEAQITSDATPTKIPDATGIHALATNVPVKKPESSTTENYDDTKRPIESSATENHTEKPMIQVPVITVDQKLPSHQSEEEKKPVFQMLNTFSAEKLNPQNNTHSDEKTGAVGFDHENKPIKTDPLVKPEKVFNKPSVAAEPVTEQTATLGEKVTEMIEINYTPGNREPVVAPLTIKPPISQSSIITSESFSKLPESDSPTTMTVVSETHSTSMKISGHDEIPLREPISTNQLPNDINKFTDAGEPEKVTEKLTTITVTESTSELTTRKSETPTEKPVEVSTENSLLSQGISFLGNLPQTVSSIVTDFIGNDSSNLAPVLNDGDKNVSSEVTFSDDESSGANSLSKISDPTTMPSIQTSTEKATITKNPIIIEGPVYEKMPQIIPDHKAPIHGSSPSEVSSIEHIIETLNDPTGIISTPIGADQFNIQKIPQSELKLPEASTDQTGLFKITKIPEIQTTSATPINIETLADANSAKPMEPLPTELADSLTSMISQISDVRPSVLPLGQNVGLDTTEKKSVVSVNAEEPSDIDSPPASGAEEVSKTPQDPLNGVQLTIKAEPAGLAAAPEKVMEVHQKLTPTDSDAAKPIEPLKTTTNTELQSVVSITTKSPSLDSSTTGADSAVSMKGETQEPVNRISDKVSEKNEITVQENSKLETNKINASDNNVTDKTEEHTVELIKIASQNESVTTKETLIEENSTKKSPTIDINDAKTTVSTPSTEHIEEKTSVTTNRPTTAQEPMKSENPKTEKPLKIQLNKNDTKLPIVHLDIKEAVPTQFNEASDSTMNESKDKGAESPLVRIKLTDPVALINSMIDSSNIDAQPTPVEPLSLPETGSVPPNTLASGLIAGFPSTTKAPTTIQDGTAEKNSTSDDPVKSVSEVSSLSPTLKLNMTQDQTITGIKTNEMHSDIEQEPTSHSPEKVNAVTEKMEIATKKSDAIADPEVLAEKTIIPTKSSINDGSSLSTTTADSVAQIAENDAKVTPITEVTPTLSTTVEVTNTPANTNATSGNLNTLPKLTDVTTTQEPVVTTKAPPADDKTQENRVQLSGLLESDGDFAAYSKVNEIPPVTTQKTDTSTDRSELAETKVEITTAVGEFKNSTNPKFPEAATEGLNEATPSTILLTEVPIVETTAATMNPLKTPDVEITQNPQIATVTPVKTAEIIQETDSLRQKPAAVSSLIKGPFISENNLEVKNDGKKTEKVQPSESVDSLETTSETPTSSLAPQQTAEVRIQVNDTAVLVTKKPAPDTSNQKLDEVTKLPNNQPIEEPTTPKVEPVSHDSYEKLGEKISFPVPVPVSSLASHENSELNVPIQHASVGLDTETRIRLGDEQTEKMQINKIPMKTEDTRKPIKKTSDSDALHHVDQPMIPNAATGNPLSETNALPSEIKENISALAEPESTSQLPTKIEITLKVPSKEKLNVAPVNRLGQDQEQPLEILKNTTSIELSTETPAPKPEKPAHKLAMNIKKDDSLLKPTDEQWTLIPQKVPPAQTKTAYPKRPVAAEAPSTTNTPVSEKVSSTERPPVSLDHPQSASGLDSTVKNLETDVSYFVNLCNELAFTFWTATNKGLSTARSLAVSPFGMTSMLAMVFLGARGPTSDQMNDVLKLDDVASFNPHLVFQNVTDAVGLARNQGIANAAFVRELFADRSKVRKLMPFYKEQAQQFYDGIVAEVNFATISDLVRRRTNLMIRKQTGGRIKDFVRTNTVPLRSPLAALSANVFQTDCNSSAASSEGRDGELYFAVSPAVRQRKLVPVPATVWRAGVLAGYEPGLDATAIALGGTDKLVSTIFVIPGQQGLTAPGDTLDRLEQRLVRGATHDGSWNKLLKVLIPRPGLELQVPKFSHRSVINATAALKRMGLEELFSKHADLKGINGLATDLHLADVLQMNLFSTCGDQSIISGRHHVEVYPGSPLRNARDNSISEKEFDKSESEPSFNEDDGSEGMAVPYPLHRKTSAARQIDTTEKQRLKLDRPFLYFVRHNPTGLILHMGRFNPRLLP